MEKIEFTTDVKFGDEVITSIEVKPLTFLEMGKLWDEAAKKPGKPETVLQRERIRFQAHFMGGTKRIVPDDAQLGQLPVGVAKSIIAALDNGNGKMGKVLAKGDGIVSPIHIQLGQPIAMKDNKGDSSEISELEFQATTYAEVEDILASDNEVKRAIMLLSLASPVGSKLSRLPGWAIDRMTVADGLLIMREVSPSF